MWRKASGTVFARGFVRGLHMNRRDFFKGALAIMAAPLLSLLPEREKVPDLTDASNDLPKLRLVCGEPSPSADWVQTHSRYDEVAEWTFLVPSEAETARFVGGEPPYMVLRMKDGSQQKSWPLPVQKEAGK